jgi:hypothetical protein
VLLSPLIAEPSCSLIYVMNSGYLEFGPFLFPEVFMKNITCRNRIQIHSLNGDGL